MQDSSSATQASARISNLAEAREYFHRHNRRSMQDSRTFSPSSSSALLMPPRCGRRGYQRQWTCGSLQMFLRAEYSGLRGLLRWSRSPVGMLAELVRQSMKNAVNNINKEGGNCRMPALGSRGGRRRRGHSTSAAIPTGAHRHHRVSMQVGLGPVGNFAWRSAPPPMRTLLARWRVASAVAVADVVRQLD